MTDNHITESMAVYTPPTPEEVEAKTKAFNDRLMKYAMVMARLESLYHQRKITIDKYYLIQEVFSEYYNFPPKSIYYWDGPHNIEHIEQEEHKRRSYVRRNEEYWEEYEKKHKKQ